MNKLLIIILSILLFLLLVVAGLFLFTFSQAGNDMLKPYLKQELERKMGLPVEVSGFKLESGASSLDMVINKQVVVNVVTNYDLWDQSFEGMYQIKANGFAYGDVKLREADIKGNFKGVAENIYVDGKGTTLDAKVDYRFKIIDNLPQQIVVSMKGVELSEVLQLSGQPALAHGKMDVEINMPNIDEDTASGDGHVVLKKAYFNRKLVKKLYAYTLPGKSYVNGRIDATLEGKNVKLLGNMQSNLFVVQINNALMDMVSGQLTAGYHMDIKDMRILTKNKLAGPFKLEGKVKVQDKEVQATGKSNSLGGEVHFSVEEMAKITFEKLALEKLLFLLKQPPYAKGEVSGTVMLDDISKESGTYVLHIDKGVLEHKTIKKMFRYHIPAKNSFSLESEGKIADKNLTASVTVHSTLSDVTLSALKYDFVQKTLISNYHILLHDVNVFVPAVQVRKGTAVSAEGLLKLTDKISVSGVTNGLGKRVAFSYDGTMVKVDTSQLFVEKALALAGLPVYAKGTIDSQVVLANLKAPEGTFSLQSANLVTQPKEIKKLMGKALKVTMALDTSGTFKKGKGYIDAKMKTSLGNLSLDNMVYDTQNNTFKSAYMLDIPNLTKLHTLIDRKLYGPLVLSGRLTKEKTLKATGVTTSLGGKLNYTLIGDNLSGKISSVPLTNILGTLGYKKNFLGQASGKWKYHLKQKSGVVDLDIASFQLKPSTLTNTIKMFLGKDPARVIFSSTKFHANIKGGITDYSLLAKGTRSSIEIRNGRINTANNAHTATFKFVYEKYRVNGKIKGTLDNPKVTLDTASLLKDKLDDGLKDKLDKALGEKAGEFLKGLSF